MSARPTGELAEPILTCYDDDYRTLDAGRKDGSLDGALWLVYSPLKLTVS
jgi:hypothetical protein